ncbi:MAG TPA: hypothetical protein VN419_04655 [Humidesulfovibrio sp.]|uniref:hypothetical protein n=1 Tax=Humidesulfovibrio sp. TaxID=2910988 RepID=UPI002CC49C10|nr:hypothetical protein [Humidesulfovibrio sp.]HWR03290.1 hypothetical protein [Humidesulfovibrio sp.]
MGRTLGSQIKGVWASSGILQVGTSRFRAKIAARDTIHREGNGATSARIAEHTPITSYRTYDVYKSVSLDFAAFAEGMGVRHVRDIRPEHAEAYMLSKLEEGRSCNTLRTCSAALGKLDVALSMVPRAMLTSAEARLSPGLDAVRARCNALAPRLDTGRRAYSDPQGLVRAVSEDGFRLVARLQLEAGLRVSEALNVGRGDLAGETVDPVTRRWSGLLHIAGKGGHERIQYVPIQTYRDLELRLDENSGTVGVNYKPYLAALHKAADAACEQWGGTHGLRHNYVRAFLVEAVERGLGVEESMREAMERVGHHRISELRTYCR